MAYLPLMQFMLQHDSYEWAWEVEFDTRYIGHWGRWGCRPSWTKPLAFGALQLCLLGHLSALSWITQTCRCVICSQGSTRRASRYS